MPVDTSAGTECNVVGERNEDSIYVASAPGLLGCHTQAPIPDLLLERIKEATALHLETETIAVPSLEFIGERRVTVAA